MIETMHYVLEIWMTHSWVTGIAEIKELQGLLAPVAQPSLEVQQVSLHLADVHHSPNH